MSRDELKVDVDGIYTLATTLAIQDGLPLSALRDPEMSRSYLGRAVADYVELVVNPRRAELRRVTLPLMSVA
jgi:hypothetical protein